MTLFNSEPGISNSTLRWFGLTAGLSICTVGWLVSKWVPFAITIGFAGGLALACSYYMLPRVQPGIIRLWRKAFFPVSFVVGHLLFAFVFFVIVLPVGLIRRTFKRGQNAPNRQQFESSWEPIEQTSRLDRYLRQF